MVKIRLHRGISRTAKKDLLKTVRLFQKHSSCWRRIVAIKIPLVTYVKYQKMLDYYGKIDEYIDPHGRSLP